MTIPITITIPAATATGNGILNYSARGKYFLVKATNGEFLVTTDTGQQYDIVNPGERFGEDSSPTFKKLFFANPTGEPVTLTFYATMIPIQTPDASISSTVTATATLTNTLANCAAETEGQFQVTWAAGGAVRFAAPGTYCRRIIIIAQASLDRAANAANVFIGNSVAHQPITLAPGDTWTIEADTGGKRDLGSWYVLGGTAGDGVSVLYV